MKKMSFIITRLRVLLVLGLASILCLYLCFGRGGSSNSSSSPHGHGGHNSGGAAVVFPTVGLWIYAMGCSLLVSMASLICLIILPVICFKGKPSKTFVDSLATFGAGAMLGDAFLHQLPHAFGAEHSHSHHDLAGPGQHSHSHSHSHSLKDLSIGLSILFGIVLFLLVEKVVRYVEERSSRKAAKASWVNGHHHHHKVKDDDAHALSIDALEANLDNNKRDTLRKRVTANGNGVFGHDDKPAEVVDYTNTNGMTTITQSTGPSNLVFGYLNLFSDGVHNFSDGMALGSAFLLYGSVGGWSRTLFLLAHELPQEIGDFGILVRSGFSVKKALFFNFLSALAALAGTALALLLGQDPGQQSSLIEGFTAGGFIYIAVAGVLPGMNNSKCTTFTSTAIQLTSLISGMAVALYISLVE